MFLFFLPKSNKCLQHGIQEKCRFAFTNKMVESDSLPLETASMEHKWECDFSVVIETSPGMMLAWVQSWLILGKLYAPGDQILHLQNRAILQLLLPQLLLLLLFNSNSTANESQYSFDCNWQKIQFKLILKRRKRLTDSNIWKYWRARRSGSHL